MTRLWNSSQRARSNGATATAPAPSLPPPPELIEPGRRPVDEPSPYVSRPVRPLAQLIARVGLWTAVGFGCLGGLVGLIRPSGGGAEPVATDSSTDAEIVPAPVAGIAERVVEEWLVATPDDQDRLAALFVDPPDLNDVTTETLTLLDVTTVAGERLNEGYWTVTVAADVIETLPDGDTAGGDTAAADGTAEGGTGTGEEESADPPVTTWYVEVGIVGDVWQGLAALTTPAIVPAPAAAESRWRLIPADTYEPDEGDQLAATIEGFLNALLASDGDPARYLATGVRMHAADPAPFVEVEVEGLAAEEIEGGDVRVWVEARGTTAGGSRQVLSYEIVAVERVDRWEIRELWGAPTVEPVPEGEEQSPAADLPEEGSEPDGSEVDGSEVDGTSTADTSTDGTSGSGDGTEATTGSGAEDPAASEGSTESPVPEQGQ